MEIFIVFFTHLLKTNVNFFVIKTFQVGRNRLVPEYTFMDPRGVGAWNMESLSRVEEAVWAMDSMEAGEDGKVRFFICFFDLIHQGITRKGIPHQNNNIFHDSPTLRQFS